MEHNLIANVNTASEYLDQATLITPWISYSVKHKEKLKRVARRQNVESIDTYWYHKDPIGIGSFGHVFAGISKKDGREIAIKKIEKRRMVRPEDRREITSLTALADCPQVVKYIYFDDKNNDFAYIVLELMEGHLDDYLTSPSFKPHQSISLCRDLLMGVKYLHDHEILHRDLKPGNILYKVHPKLCLKIADFGLSSLLTTTEGTTVLGTNAGTRCWIAPEVISSDSYKHTKESDMYSCGLLLHYILSPQRHPFSPVDCSNKTKEIIEHEIQTNMMAYTMEGWDVKVSPEATHLIKGLLSKNANERPSAADCVSHPWCWRKKEKLEFLYAVGNQPEIERPLPTSGHLPPVLSDLEVLFLVIVKYPTWNNAGYTHMPAIYAEMTKPIARGRAPPRPARKYNTGSVIELIRFVRNAISRVSEASRPQAIRQQILDHAVFLDYFPDLVIEVYKIVILKHGWYTRLEIKHAMPIANDTNLYFSKSSESDLSQTAKIPSWTPYSVEHREKLDRVARKQNVESFDTYWYHEKPIGSGSFGHVFAGISEKDGREIAIKRIDKLSIVGSRNEREIRNLACLSHSSQVVDYICFYEKHKDFAFIVLELMEGNLDEYLSSSSFNPLQSVRLCRDLVMGMKYLHEHKPKHILHRDLKPGNILYKTYPKLCLKIADFDLSSAFATTSGKSMQRTNAGTRCWIAPEVISSSSCKHTKESDMYSCGLLLHYILSPKNHPFRPTDYLRKSGELINHETLNNMITAKMESFDISLSREQTHLITCLLSSKVNERPSAADSVSHPWFWANKTKLELLCAVGNQPEFERPPPTFGPLPQVESDLEVLFPAIVKYPTWHDAGYTHMPAIYAEMTKPIVRGRDPPRPARKYNTGSVVELIRFVRNAIRHVSEASRPQAIRQQILGDAVFLDYFPDLVIEVYKIVIIKHEWHTREEIKHAMSIANDTKLNFPLKPSESDLSQTAKIPSWTPYSVTHREKLDRVARRENVESFDHDTYWYHKKPIGSGSFGHVFAGISKKDGREIAIKRIDKLSIVGTRNEREIKNLAALSHSSQVVDYICFYENHENFAFIVLELMEGNLDEYFSSSSFNPSQSDTLCSNLVMGIKCLHEHKPNHILHRDLKPGNILYKTYPKLCLKIADFDLSSAFTATSGNSVQRTNAGTRCWIAPEVISSPSYKHTKESDMYSCGLLLHYILSPQRHPFRPTDYVNKNKEMIEHEIQTNMMAYTMEGWDSNVSPEGTNLIEGLLSKKPNERSSAADSVSHPLFWTKKKKLAFLYAVGNQPEIEWKPVCGPLDLVQYDLETLFTIIVKYPTWDDAGYTHMPAIYKEMIKKGNYRTNSLIKLIRFIRNSISHVSEAGRTPAIRQQILDHAVFLDYFPNLVMEVYKIVIIKHGWNTREEIKHAMSSEDK